MLGGMEPVNGLKTESGGKIFAGLYALFSGLIFWVVVGLIIVFSFASSLAPFSF